MVNVVAVVVVAIAAILAPNIVTGRINVEPYIVQYIEYVDEAERLYFELWGIIGISVLDFCGSMIVCRNYKRYIKTNKSILETLVACTLMQFGGTTITGLILGQTPSWMLSLRALPALLLAFWLTFCAPLSAILSSSLGAVMYDILAFGAAISGGHAITSWGMDKAFVNTFHLNANRISQSTVVCILTGTLSGCGGGLLADWLGLYNSQSFVPAETPGIFRLEKKGAASALTKAAVLACVYYCLVAQDHVPSLVGFDRPLLSKEEGRAVIVTLQIVNFLITSLFPSIEPFPIIWKCLQTLLLVPGEVKCRQVNTGKSQYKADSDALLKSKKVAGAVPDGAQGYGNGISTPQGIGISKSVANVPALRERGPGSFGGSSYTPTGTPLKGPGGSGSEGGSPRGSSGMAGGAVKRRTISTRNQEHLKG